MKREISWTIFIALFFTSVIVLTCKKHPKDLSKLTGEELMKLITFTVQEKSFLKSDSIAGRYNDYIVFRGVWQSKIKIRTFSGIIRVRDLSDKDICHWRIAISRPEPVRAGAKVSWSDSLMYNEFSTVDRALLDTELKCMKIMFLPKSFSFEPGYTWQ